MRLGNAIGINCKMEGRSVSFTALSPDLTAHEFNQPAAHCQPKSNPVIFASQRIIHLAKGLKETIPPIDWNANAGILDSEMNQTVVSRRDMNRNLTVICELDRIFQQTTKDLFEPSPIADNDRWCIIIYLTSQT